MPRPKRLCKTNCRIAKVLWPTLTRASVQKLRVWSQELSLSVAAGDLIYLEHGWYVTHTGLLRLAARNRCAGIDVRPLTKSLIQRRITLTQAGIIRLSAGPLRPELKLPMIAARDIGTFAAEALLRPDLRDQQVSERIARSA